MNNAILKLVGTMPGENGEIFGIFKGETQTHKLRGVSTKIKETITMREIGDDATGICQAWPKAWLAGATQTALF